MPEQLVIPLEVVEEEVISDEKEEEKDDNNSENGDIIINEIMIGQDGNTKKEFIELYNTTNDSIDLEGWSLKKLTKSGSKSNLLSASKFKGAINKKSYFVITHPSYTNIEKYDVYYSGASYSISKDNSVILYDNNDSIIDALCWGACDHECPGKIFKENPPVGMSIASDDEGNYLITRTPTPGEKNNFPPKQEYSNLLRINEVLPNPDGTDKNNEWVEVLNLDKQDVDLNDWKIENGSKKLFTIKGLNIKMGSLLKIAIINTSMSVRNTDEELRIIDPNGDVVDEVKITGYASSGLSYNKSPEGDWNWSKYLTPGDQNKLNNKPRIKIKKDKKVYVDVYANFDGSKSYDVDGEKLKFKWDFGDGRKSYLKKTRHKYEKKGKYKVVLTVGDGVDETKKGFTIDVKKFPKYDIQIVGLLPNPKGIDKGHEMIMFINNESKRINLKGFYIQTGRNKKHSIRHIINKNFFLKPGEVKKISNEKICKYSLYNKKGAVVLSTPSGSWLDSIRYSREKIYDNDYYFLNKENNWEWIINTPEEKIKQEVVFSSSTDIQIKGDFHWSRITQNERLKQCETIKTQKIANWFYSNKHWNEELLKFLNIETFSFDALS